MSTRTVEHVEQCTGLVDRAKEMADQIPMLMQDDKARKHAAKASKKLQEAIDELLHVLDRC